MTDKKDADLKKRFSTRITTARQGRDAYIAKDYLTATKKYNEYLGIIAQMHESDPYSLSPSKFDPKSDITEMLFISHIYWDLSRIYSKTPKLSETYQKCLNQFVKFTVNQPYQVVNSEIIRKYIKKNNSEKLIQTVKDAYSQIHVESKKCYIASYAFGEEDIRTNQLRQFKKTLMNYPMGEYIVAIYYRFSTALIKVVNRSPFLNLLTKITFVPLLIIFTYI